jgi:hypothetical protein
MKLMDYRLGNLRKKLADLKQNYDAHLCSLNTKMAVQL